MSSDFFESKEYESMMKRYWLDQGHNLERWYRIRDKIKEEHTCYDYLYKNMFHMKICHIQNCCIN